MGETESVERLRKLGLNLYESKAYLALISEGRLTAKELGQYSTIPQSRTYDVLESLTEKGFAVSTPSSPPAYLSVPPARILTPYYNTEKKKIQDSVSKVDQEAEAKLEGIRDAYLTLVKELPNLAVRDVRTREEVWVLRERENIEGAMITLIQESKSELLRITRPPELSSNSPPDPFYILGLGDRRFVYDALGRGVKMRWLSLEREIPAFVGLNVKEPPERRYLQRDDQITEKFFLADKESVLLNLRDPVSQAFGSVALMMRSKAASSIFMEHFEKMWEAAKPMGEVLPRMKSLVDQVCAKLREIGLSKSEVLLFRTAANVGASSKDVLIGEMARRRVAAEVASASLEKLMRLGFIRRDAALRLFSTEDPAKVKTSVDRSAAKLAERSP